MIEMPENKWSNCRDKNQEQFSKIPEKPGVYMMHASMKILFIGGSQNMKKSTVEALEKNVLQKQQELDSEKRMILMK